MALQEAPPGGGGLGRIDIRAHGELGVGVQLRLRPDRRVHLRAARPPSAAVLRDLHRHRDGVAALLGERERVAFLARAAVEAAEALATPDPDLAWERRQIAAAQAVGAPHEHWRPASLPGPKPISEAAEAFDPLPPEADHEAVLTGLLAAGLQRPPAWSDPDSPPPPGAWCGCCGRFGKSGGRWWREAVNPSGWRCWTCHPPAHLAPGVAVEQRT